MIKKDLTGIILAGGKSSRMGQDKGMIFLAGKPFVQYLIDALKPHVHDILIIAHDDKYQQFGYSVKPDLIPQCGPIGGIYTGLMNSNTPYNMVVGCDTPLINSDLIKYILDSSSENVDICVPLFQHHIEPLCSIYSTKIAPALKFLIEQKKWKLRDIIEHFTTHKINIPEHLPFYQDQWFMNINTPEELNMIKKQYEYSS